MNLVYDGHMTCSICSVATCYHRSGLCAHCQAHECQCVQCFQVVPWDELRNSLCAACYPTTQFKYTLKPKGKPA